MSFVFLYAQEKIPQNYFGNPLKIDLILAGTFGELRSNHFHSGVDIKTQQREGLSVYATAAGYVSRIKISPWGYGKAIYIKHPNGYTTVYAHLKKFTPKIEQYVKKAQYAQEKFAVELFPDKDVIPITKDQKIAFSGNTGGSGGPHLHYEIRNHLQHPMNPMLFGFSVKDSSKPLINGVYAYSFGDSSQVNNHQKKLKLKLKKLKDGNYVSNTIYASGSIGFGVQTIDKQDLARNKNGVYNIKTFLNGTLNYELDFKKFAFRESRHLNQLIDYKTLKKDRITIQKLYKNESNPLSIIKNANQSGKILLSTNEQINYTIQVTDFNGNIRTVTIPIIEKKLAITNAKQTPKEPYYAYATQGLQIIENEKEVSIPKNALYENTEIHFDQCGDTISIGNKHIPLHKNISLSFNTTKFKDKDISKLFVSSLGYKNKPYYITSYHKDGIIIGKTKTFGKFTLTSDYDKPIITPVNTQDKKWMSNATKLQIKITDKLSGVKKFRATINGIWALMEYDAKKDLLTYNFEDNIHQAGENKFKLIVIDNVGNNSIFEMTFFRKQ